jgi:3-oxoadipate enol-lactonase
VKGIRARLYYDAGVRSVPALAAWKPEALRQMLVEFVERTGFEGSPPLPKEARSTVENAGALVVIGSTPIAFPLSALEMAGLRYSQAALGLWAYGSLAKLFARSTALRPEVRECALEAIRQVDRKTFLAIWVAVNSAVRREGCPDFRLEIPLLLTHGDRDTAGTIRRDAPRWAATDPAIHYEVIPRAGHNANQDNPPAYSRVLGEFLQVIDGQD